MVELILDPLDTNFIQRLVLLCNFSLKTKTQKSPSKMLGLLNLVVCTNLVYCIVAHWPCV